MPGSQSFSSMKKVSVVIPTYKRPDLLLQAITSVLKQTYPNVEVIVVDDNDPDTPWREKTAQAMARFADDPRVQYICHERNQNGSAARNTGIAHATGAYICFLDDDDLFFSEKLEKQLAYLEEHPHYAGCFCNRLRGNRPREIPWMEDYSRQIFLCKPIPQTSSLMLRTQAVRALHGFNAAYVRYQDYEFLLRFYKAGFRLGKIDEVLYVYGWSAINNIPHGTAREKAKRKLLTEFHDLIVKLDERERGFYKRVYALNMSSVVCTYLKHKDPKNSLRVWREMCRVSLGYSLLYFSRNAFKYLCFKFKGVLPRRGSPS